MNDLIIAHRGIYNNKNIPENSMLSFKKALVNNYSIELDVTMTKDNILIVFHDDNLKRMTKLNNRICNMTYNEIKNLYLLNTKEKIPSLDDVLKLINGKVLLLIEIKSDKRYKIIIDKLIKLLDNYRGNYLIESFDYRNLIYLKAKKVNIKRGLIISNNKNKLYKYFIDCINIKRCKVDFISISKKLVNNNGYQKFIERYISLIWTIKSEEELATYINKHYGFICDNLPYKKEFE